MGFCRLVLVNCWPHFAYLAITSLQGDEIDGNVRQAPNVLASAENHQIGPIGKLYHQKLASGLSRVRQAVKPLPFSVPAYVSVVQWRRC